MLERQANTLHFFGKASRRCWAGLFTLILNTCIATLYENDFSPEASEHEFDATQFTCPSDEGDLPALLPFANNQVESLQHQAVSKACSALARRPRELWSMADVSSVVLAPFCSLSY